MTSIRVVPLCALGLLAVACGGTQSNRGSKNPDASMAGADAGTDAGTGSNPIDPPLNTGPCNDVVDVVFVLDLSSSMRAALEKLDKELEVVVAAANKLAPDSHFGLIPFSDKYILDKNGVLSDGRVHTEAKTLQAAFKKYMKENMANDCNPGDVCDNPLVGIGNPLVQGSGTWGRNPVCEENSLDSLYAAATEFPWRTNATRLALVVTDDTFLERPDNYGKRADGGFNIALPEHDAPAKWTLAEAVAKLKEQRIRVFSFTRLKSSDIPLACGTGRRFTEANVSDGWSTPYNGAGTIPSSTGGKNFDVTQVMNGTTSLSTTINEVVVDSYCNPIFQ